MTLKTGHRPPFVLRSGVDVLHRHRDCRVPISSWIPVGARPPLLPVLRHEDPVLLPTPVAPRTGRSFGARSLPAAERGLGWGKNRPCQRPIPLSLATPHYSLGAFSLRWDCATRRFWHGKSGLEDASDYSRKTPSQTFHIFSPRRLNDLGPWVPSNPQSVPYSGTGPRKRNLGGMTLVFPPLSATAISPGGWERCYVSQCRRLNHQAEHPHRRPTRLPTHRQVTKIAR